MPWASSNSSIGRWNAMLRIGPPAMNRSPALRAVVVGDRRAGGPDAPMLPHRLPRGLEPVLDIAAGLRLGAGEPCRQRDRERAPAAACGGPRAIPADRMELGQLLLRPHHQELR